jgi:hypothetical protein
MYAVDDLTPVSLDYPTLRDALGYRPTWNPQRFQVFDGDKGQALTRVIVEAVPVAGSTRSDGRAG